MDIESLIESLTTCIQKTTDERIARDKYDGYSWDWHGRALIYEADCAKKSFIDKLNKYIDSRVQKLINERVDNEGS